MFWESKNIPFSCDEQGLGPTGITASSAAWGKLSLADLSSAVDRFMCSFIKLQLTTSLMVGSVALCCGFDTTHEVI